MPNLSTLAQQKYDLVIAVGFLMAEATNTVAKRFPNVKFAIIDFSQAGLKDKPTNVQGLLFKEQEAGYLVGYLAGLYAKDESAKAISTVGGQKIPPVDHYIAGFQAGAKEANADVQDAQRLLRRTSSTRRSARRSRWTRSPRGPRSSSRWPASAGSARSTRQRRSRCRPSASTPTRPTSAPRS